MQALVIGFAVHSIFALILQQSWTKFVNHTQINAWPCERSANEIRAARRWPPQEHRSQQERYQVTEHFRNRGVVLGMRQELQRTACGTSWHTCHTMHVVGMFVVGRLFRRHRRYSTSLNTDGSSAALDQMLFTPFALLGLRQL